MLRLPVVVLSDKKIRAICDACDFTPAGDRDEALVRFLYGTGLRVSEALSITREDVDFEKGIVFVRNGKNSKTRTVVASADALEAIIPYFKASQRGESLFKMTDSALRKRMRKLAAKLDMPRLNAHSIRHAHAVALMKAGVGINHIQQQLGHSNIGTTSLYLQRYSPDERMLAISAALNGAK
jgi:integrase/recombinase XerD